MVYMSEICTLNCHQFQVPNEEKQQSVSFRRLPVSSPALLVEGVLGLDHVVQGFLKMLLQLLQGGLDNTLLLLQD